MSQAFRSAFSHIAFVRSESLVRYREWAADKRDKYERRCLYDSWAVSMEDRIIKIANEIIADTEKRP